MTQEISLITAFFAGTLSFFAPCILPMLPPYFAWAWGVSQKDLHQKKLKIKLLLNAFLLLLGFAVVFIILGASASKIGQSLAPYRLLAQKIGGAIIIIFGLEFIGFLKIFKNYKQNLIKKIFDKFNPQTSSFLVGLTFAFAWTACLSPILGSILVLSSFQDSLNQGILLLAVYTAGLAMPFLISSLFLGFIMQKTKSFQKIIKYSNIVSGFILIILGLLLITDNYYKIVAWFGRIL